jgi:ribA/ribD-fused uncharacterized protein
MSKGIFADRDQQAIYFARSNINEDFGTFAKHPFFLEELEWPSVEHYFQAMKFEDKAYQESIRCADHPKKARKLGRTRFRRIRKDWRSVKVVYMTRAVYTLCRTYPDIAAKLVATGSNKMVESSQYDYFWGCGRDRRGDNHYGKVLMSVRDRLVEEADLETVASP